MNQPIEVNGVKLNDAMLAIIKAWREHDYTTDSVAVLQEVQDTLIELAAENAEPNMSSRLLEHLVAIGMLKNDLKTILHNDLASKKGGDK